VKIRTQLSLYVPQAISAPLEDQAPHITLADPGNPKALSNNAVSTAMLSGNLAITFPSAYRIQQEGFEPWQVLEQYTLSLPIAATPLPQETPAK
jgi:hypothetical protein